MRNRNMNRNRTRTGGYAALTFLLPLMAFMTQSTVVGSFL